MLKVVKSVAPMVHNLVDSKVLEKVEKLAVLTVAKMALQKAAMWVDMWAEMMD